MTTDYERSGDFGSQLALDGHLPEEGSTWLNTHNGHIATVEKVIRRRYDWIQLRLDGRQTEIPLSWLTEHYKPCRPDGTLR